MLKETEVGSCMVWPMAWKMNGKQLNYAAEQVKHVQEELRKEATFM